MAVTDVSKLASCTSCTFDQDLSNYWTANVYFQARNGSFKRVPQMVNDQIGAANAGITVYYTAPGPKTVTAFKPVWLYPWSHKQVLASANVVRGSGCFLETSTGARRADSARISRAASAATPGSTLAATRTRRAWTRSVTPRRSRRPRAPAVFGQAFCFPCAFFLSCGRSDRQKRDITTDLVPSSCWDGKNLDSPNHMDHLAHPTDHPASFAVVGSTCPSTHPVKIPQVHYEVRDIGR